MKHLIALALVALCLTGCASYYKVVDPSSGNTYYTKEIKKRNSAVEFIDQSSKATVTVQNSEVHKIDQDAYLAGLASQSED